MGDVMVREFADGPAAGQRAWSAPWVTAEEPPPALMWMGIDDDGKVRQWVYGLRDLAYLVIRSTVVEDANKVTDRVVAKLIEDGFAPAGASLAAGFVVQDPTTGRANVNPTERERREKATADRLEAKAQADARMDALRAVITDPVLLAVLELHQPAGAEGPSWGGYLVCYGCDWGDYAEGPAPWPCSTVDLIEERCLTPEVSRG